MATYVYQCPVCKGVIKLPIAPTAPPTCEGAEKTHYKVMQFVADKSTGTPSYLNKEKKK